MRKRLLSLLLAFTMVLSMVPGTAMAAEEATDLGSVHVIVENTTLTEEKYNELNESDWDADTNGKFPYGSILSADVTLTADMTMMSAIKAALDANKIESVGADGTYISSINGLAEFDGGSGSGWKGTLNDWFVNMGFADWKVSEGELVDGDEIRVMYTCDMGADLGGEYGTNYGYLSALTSSEGVLSPEFNKDTVAYSLTLNSGVETVDITATAENKEDKVTVAVGETEYRRGENVPVSNGKTITITCGVKTYTVTVVEQETEVPAPATYTVTLPAETTGYTVAAAEGSASPVTENGSYSFTVEIAEGYEAGENFAVKANEIKLTTDDNGVYTIENITADQVITVEGVEEKEFMPTFSTFDLYTSSSAYNNGSAPLEMTPQFESTKLDGYAVVAPDYVKSLYVVAELSKDTIASGNNYTIMVSNSWSGWSGVRPSDNTLKASAYFTQGYVDIYFLGSEHYKVNVSQYATLSGLTVDGVMEEAFDRDTMTYHVLVDSTAEGVAITPTAYRSADTITINGTAVTGGEAYTLPYAWGEEDTMTVEIVVSGTDRVSTTYTVVLEKMPRNDQPTILEQPVEADYIVADVADALFVTASANGEMTYQWYVNTENSNRGGSAIEGATSASYVPSTETVGTVYYYCVVTNTGAESGNVAVSDAVRVTVDPDPTPVVNFVNIGNDLPDDGTEYASTKGYVYAVGATPTDLEITATSAAEGGTWSYQWMRNNSATGKGGAVVGGATGTTVTPETSASYAGGLFYRCQVKYTFKGKTYTAYSDTGLIDEASGKAITGVYVYVKVAGAAVPTIATQPVSAEYVEGDTAANLSVYATKTDSGKLTYQWYVNTENSNQGGTAIEGATSSGYALGNVTEVGTKYYYCVVTNTIQGYSASVTTETAAITVVSVADKVGNKLTGSGTEADPYVLSDAEDFQNLADLVAQGVSFAGMYFEVTADVELPETWAGIGALKAGTTSTSSGKNILPFSGILDGGEHTITFAYGSKPLFKYVREAAVMNLNIKGEYIADDGLVSDYCVDYGSDGSYNSGTGGSYASGCPDIIDITNVHILSGTTIKGSGLIGGYASGGNIVNISNCTVASEVKIGWDAEANASAEASKVGSVGGDFNGTITNCTSAATVYGKNYVGGIVGAKGQSMGPYSVEKCEFTGEIIASGNYVGGIAGSGYTSASAPNSPCADILNCSVTGNVTGANYVGGIFGGETAIAQCWENGTGEIKNNYFHGTVTATDENGVAGGIIGYMHSLNKYNDIADNFYESACGADKGIGSVKYVDTNCAEPTAVDGVIYVDSSQGKPDYTGFAKTDHNRTDDPLGADADKLAKAMSNCTATFYGHTAQLNTFKVYTYTNGVKGEIDLLEGVKDSDDSNTQTYTAALAAGDYWVEGYDANGDCSGGIMVTVAAGEENEFTVLRAYQIKASNSGWVLGTDYTIRAEVTAADMTARIVEMGTAADYSGNQLPSVLCLHGDTVKVVYTPTEVRKAENYIETFKSVTLTSNSSSFSVSIPQAVAVTFVVPKGAEVDAGRFHTYYIYDFAEATSVVDNEDGTTSYTFMIPKSTQWFYRVQHEDGVTYWNYSSWSADTTVTITADDLYIGSSEFNKDTIYRYEKNVYDRADIYLNINGQGYMDMDVGDSFQLNVFRNWMAIESYMNAKVALPDMTYTVIDVNGNPSNVLTITPDENNSSVATMTANSAGTAIVLVTYDAMTHMVGQSSTASKQFSAIWPECTGVFVVTVGENGEADIDTGMTMERYDAADTTMDAEHDILFYLGNEGAEFTFAPESGTTVTVARAALTSNSLTYSGFTSTGVTANEDGTVTVSSLTSGRHIIKVEKDGKATYQVVTARGVSYEMQKLDEDGNYVAMTEAEIAAVRAGDTVYLQFSNLVNPAEKLSGAYNFNASILYYDENDNYFRSVPGSNFGVYDFSGNPVRQRIEITIPQYWTKDTYTLNGAIKMGGFGNVSVGGHRGVTYASGLNTNFNADTVGMTLSAMPEITIALAATDFVEGVLTFVGDQGESIDRANVTIVLTDENGEETVVAEDGTFLAVPGTYSYVISCAGYMYTTGSFAVGEDDTSVGKKLTLQAAPESAWDGVNTTEPSADENGVYLIGTGAELAWFAKTVNEGNVSASAKLTADISLADYPWTPIGNNSKRYTGTFDGAGHTVYDMNVSVTAPYAGLFGGMAGGAVVKDLTVKGMINSTVANRQEAYAGGLVGYAYGSSTARITIENVVVDVDVTASGASKNNTKYVGGIAGYAMYTTYTNCTNLGDVVGGGQYVGGIAGYGSYAIITKCVNQGNITAGSNYAAGILAWTYGSSITESYNTGDVTGSQYVGGILGYDQALVNITACYNLGDITGTSYVGGLAGRLGGSSSNKAIAADCYNAGVVTATSDVGGAVGGLVNANITAANIYYLAGTAESDVAAVALTEAELKAAELDETYYAGTCDGYPALLWQTGVIFHEWCDHAGEDADCTDCAYTAPTYTVDGSIVRACKNDGCTATKTDAIPATGYTAEAVIGLIDAIGDVTLEDETAIAAARTAYDALTEEQQKLVTNYATLTAAEAALAELKNPAPAVDLNAMYHAAAATLLGQTVGTGSTSGEWLMFGLARALDKNPTDDQLTAYLDAVKTYIASTIKDTGRLHDHKSTENSRVALALTALGYDPAGFEGYDLLAAFENTTWATKQGNNAAAFALLALNAADYEASNIDALINSLLKNQLDNGGWYIASGSADLDTTAMVVQALAPYYNTKAEVKTAVDKALTFLAAKMNDAGQMSDGANDPSVETVAQVIVALTELGIDPAESKQFTKNGKTLMDGLASFFVETGFAHVAGGSYNQMATEQAFYAMVACKRLAADESSLYDMSVTRETKYTVTVSETSNGTAAVNKSEAAANAEVTITVTPAAGYELDTLTVTDASGNVVSVIGSKFTMPASNVTVAVTFKAVEDPVQNVENAIDALDVTDAGYETLQDLLHAEALYAALTDEQKQQVTNAAELTIARASFNQLLTAAKNNALQNLGLVYNGYSSDDYSAANWNTLRSAYTTGCSAITSAGYLEAVVSAYNTAVNGMAAVKELDDSITVTFRLIGDGQHADGVAGHDEYITWIPTTAYTLDADSTMYDVFVAAIADNGLSQRGASSNYVETIKAPAILGGYWLGEFDNGVNSGWMYTVNGIHPGVGLKACELQDGDQIIWHYVDDYTLEERNSSSDYYYRWLEAKDISPAQYLQQQAGQGTVPGTSNKPNTPGVDNDTAVSFLDVTVNDWFYENVKFVVENGLFEGTSDIRFSPSASMTRAMLVTVLYRLEGEPYVYGTSSFSDVRSNRWYSDAVVWATRNGIVTGYDNGLFGTNDNVTREQMAAILYRYAKYKGYNVSDSNSLTGYSDYSDISAYALKSLKWANAEGLITGRTYSTLAPQGTATRAEVAAIFHRFVENVVR